MSLRETPAFFSQSAATSLWWLQAKTVTFAPARSSGPTTFFTWFSCTLQWFAFTWMILLRCRSLL